ncbi:MAG: diaminopimelate epimerase [Micavibrio aeruginosavorus]|uniref:Diaminopimelate epimerase n=1 Tax=Micavibrio aeruginosavorus TaxID=349221 RepID=A0A7T5R198_9BACT|nr:MAG: diaminopimelate epimerase [Micavibrio aeruginosavorus]
MTIHFTKMHGLGNDFVVIDLTQGGDAITPTQAQTIADRRRGVGCDQVLVMESPRQPHADLFMRIYNPDGSEAGACGNGTRCVSALYMKQKGADRCVIETVAGLLPAKKVGDLIQVDMGEPRTRWDQIPLSRECDTLNLGILHGRQTMTEPVAVNVGNPHTVFFVDDVSRVDIEKWGPEVENHVLFPQRTNVEFAEVLTPETIRVRVWERGTGVTQACGSGACATIVAAARRGLTGRKAEIVLDGGSLLLEWRAEDNHILMTGPTTYVFDGILKS